MCPSISFVAKRVAFFVCFPALLAAEPKVLVDALPAGGSFLGATAVRMPFQDAESVDVKSIEAGLAGAISSIVGSARQNGIDYICLLSAPGDNPVQVMIPKAGVKLKLSRKNTAVIAVFFHGGVFPEERFVFSVGKPKPGKPSATVKFEKIQVPPGVTTAGWIYFNLTRIEAEAIKEGSTAAFIETSGSGAKKPVVIPGMKEPLDAFENDAVLTASWYIDPKTEAAIREMEAKKNAPATTPAEPAKASP